MEKRDRAAGGARRHHPQQPDRGGAQGPAEGGLGEAAGAQPWGGREDPVRQVVFRLRTSVSDINKEFDMCIFVHVGFDSPNERWPTGFFDKSFNSAPRF